MPEETFSGGLERLDTEGGWLVVGGFGGWPSRCIGGARRRLPSADSWQWQQRRVSSSWPARTDAS
jgi:hypothetical protein